MRGTFRVIGYDYDYHIYNDLGKRISSGSGQESSHQSAVARAEEEFVRAVGTTMTLTISKVIEVKE